MNTPLISVLMTAYNREKYIAEAIESVLASTFIDFELIIVDDCSQDRTIEIARKYETLDSRVKVYANEKNLGDYPNRNKAASYAIGKYLKYLDSDDIMNSNCLERMVFEMENYPACAFGISSRSLLELQLHYPESAYRTHFFKRGILDISPSGCIIRKDVFDQENGFLELRCVSDFEFWLRLALKYPLLELEKDLIFWRLANQIDSIPIESLKGKRIREIEVLSARYSTIGWERYTSIIKSTWDEQEYLFLIAIGSILCSVSFIAVLLKRFPIIVGSPMSEKVRLSI